MEGVMATIIMFGGNFAPRNWAFCEGQLLAISQYSALFSLLGTTFGGDGRTTFGLPDMRGRVPIHPGNGPGLSSYKLGQKGGSEQVVLQTTQIPSHTHTIYAKTGGGDETNPTNGFMATASTDFYAETHNTQMGNPASVGGGQGHNNIQPYLCVNFVLCLQGIYPSRN